MKELELKYGCNPNQKPSRIFMEGDRELPITVLSGRPGYINFMDALNGLQLVKELKKATGLAAAASFKHVSPAGAAVGLPLDDTLKKIYWVDDMGDLSPLCLLYTSRLMQTIVREQGQTLVMVTHDNNLASYADRRIRIVDGKIVAIETGGRPAEENHIEKGVCDNETDENA